MHEHTREEVISEIISEFSQSFAAARTRWTRFAEEVHPELRGPGMMILQTIRSESLSGIPVGWGSQDQTPAPSEWVAGFVPG